MCYSHTALNHLEHSWEFLLFPPASLPFTVLFCSLLLNEILFQSKIILRYAAIWISGIIRTSILLFLPFVGSSSEISKKGMKNCNRKGKCQNHRQMVRCAGQQGTRDYNPVICGLTGDWSADLKLGSSQGPCPLVQAKGWSKDISLRTRNKVITLTSSGQKPDCGQRDMSQPPAAAQPGHPYSLPSKSQTQGEHSRIIQGWPRGFAYPSIAIKPPPGKTSQPFPSVIE